MVPSARCWPTSCDPLRPPDLVVTEGATPFSASFTVDTVPGLDVSVEGEATFKQTVTQDQATGATTTTTNREYSGTAGGECRRPARQCSGSAAELGRRPGQCGGRRSGRLGHGAVRDANGQLTKVILTTTERSEATLGVGGQGGAAEAARSRRRPPQQGPDHREDRRRDHERRCDGSRRPTIDISTPEERALAERFLAEETNDAAGALDDRETYRPERAVPGDDFQNLAHRKGIVTEQDFHEVTDPYGVEAGVDAGPGGRPGSRGRDHAHRARGNRYLEPPGADDVRRSAPTP